MWKNPNTGGYNMAVAVTCPACGEKIPRPMPTYYGKNPTEEQMAAHDQVLREYACPKCGGAPGFLAPRRSFGQ